MNEKISSSRWMDWTDLENNFMAIKFYGHLWFFRWRKKILQFSLSKNVLRIMNVRDYHSFNSIIRPKQNKIRFSIILTDRNEKEKKRSMKIKSNRIPLFIGHAVKQTITKRTSRSSRSWHLSIIFIWMFCCREQFLFG